MEETVEGNQARDILVAATSQRIPDNHHRYAASKADENHARHVLRVPRQEDDSQTEHQHRADEPVLNQGQQEDAPVGKDLGQRLIANPCQRRVHHEDEPECNQQIGVPDRECGQCTRKVSED